MSRIQQFRPTSAPELIAVAGAVSLGLIAPALVAPTPAAGSGAAAHRGEGAPAEVVVRPRVLGTLGGDHSIARAVNAPGAVVGDAETSSGQNHAFLWTRARGMRDLGTLGGDYSQALDVNDHGMVVGWSRLPSNRVRAFVWTARHGMLSLGAPRGATGSRATVVNELGMVAGYNQYDNGSDSRAFVWTARHGMREVPVPGRQHAVVDLNNRGELLVKTTVGENNHTRSYVWSARTGARDLGHFGSGLPTYAQDINDRGVVVGTAWTYLGNNLRGFRWDPRDGVLRDLGTGAVQDPQCHGSSAFAINNRGQIAGTRDQYGVVCRGIVWDARLIPTEFPSTTQNDPFTPTRISRSGLVAGNASGNSWETVLRAWQPRTGKVYLLSGGDFLAGIDARDRIAGRAAFPGPDEWPRYRAVVWDVGAARR